MIKIIQNYFAKKTISIKPIKVLSKKVKQEKYTLEKLLKGMKPVKGEELDWGKPVGKEIW